VGEGEGVKRCSFGQLSALLLRKRGLGEDVLISFWCGRRKVGARGRCASKDPGGVVGGIATRFLVHRGFVKGCKAENLFRGDHPVWSRGGMGDSIGWLFEHCMVT
jgi:hypothetical protein